MSPSQSVCYLFSTCFSHHREIAIRETVLMDVVLRRSALLNRENGKQSLMCLFKIESSSAKALV